MSEHQKHTEFLRRCLVYDNSVKRHELEVEIVRIQGDARCVQNAVWLMAVVAVLAIAGLGYGVVLGDNFPYNTPAFVINFMCALGVGSLVSLIAFLGLGMVYRRRLDERREECRHLVTQLLESRLGKTAGTQDARENSASTSSPVQVVSAAQG